MTATRPLRLTKVEAAAETRAALLHAGEQLLLEQPVGTVLDQIKAPEVARRAARTTGAFYHHWPDQASYQNELIEYVLGPDRLTAADETLKTLPAAMAGGISLPELVHLAARSTLLRVRDNPLLPLFLSLWAKQAQSDRIRDLLRRNFQATSESTATGYQAVLDHYGLQMRPPFTVEMLTVTLTGLVEGLAIRASVDPEAVPFDLPSTAPNDGSTDGPWDLYSTTVLTLVSAMTTPKTNHKDTVSATTTTEPPTL